MTGERRRHPRIPMTVEVVAECSDGSQVRLTTNDISGGGAFLAWEDRDQPGIDVLKGLDPGDQFMLQVFGLLGDGGEPPRVQAQVVRVMEDGVAVQFDSAALGA